jgi:hypothetical protein
MAIAIKELKESVVDVLMTYKSFNGFCDVGKLQKIFLIEIFGCS